MPTSIKYGASSAFRVYACSHTRYVPAGSAARELTPPGAAGPVNTWQSGAEPGYVPSNSFAHDVRTRKASTSPGCVGIAVFARSNSASPLPLSETSLKTNPPQHGTRPVAELVTVTLSCRPRPQPVPQDTANADATKQIASLMSLTIETSKESKESKENVIHFIETVEGQPNESKRKTNFTCSFDSSLVLRTRRLFKTPSQSRGPCPFHR